MTKLEPQKRSFSATAISPDSVKRWSTMTQSKRPKRLDCDMSMIGNQEFVGFGRRSHFGTETLAASLFGIRRDWTESSVWQFRQLDGRRFCCSANGRIQTTRWDGDRAKAILKQRALAWLANTHLRDAVESVAERFRAWCVWDPRLSVRKLDKPLIFASHSRRRPRNPKLSLEKRTDF